MVLRRTVSRARCVSFFVVLLALIVVAPYWACDGERSELDDHVRQTAGGDYARLTDGVTRYEIAGPGDGERIVLIHGALGPMTVWDPTFASLSSAGFRVLRYDLFGRGTSDRPRVSYDEDLFQRQLVDLLAAVGWNERVHVLGSSMGAIIAARFAALHPDRVRTVGLIGPAGFPIEASPLARLLEVPILGTYAMTVFGDRMLAAHHGRYYVNAERFERARADFAEQLRYRGSKAAIHSTMLHMPMSDFSDGYRALAETRKPVLILWGRADGTFPVRHLERARELLPHAEAEVIEAAGHLPQSERPEVVVPRLVSFLRAAPVR